MKITFKIVSLCIILLLLSAMSITLYAEGPQNSTITATVVAHNSPTYSVVVPTGITADDLYRTSEDSYVDEKFAIRVSEILTLDDGQEICVRVYAENGEFTLQNADGSSTLTYKVFSNANEEQSLQNGDIFATFTEVGEQVGFIRINQKHITQADTYTGNLRFSFSVNSIEE